MKIIDIKKYFTDHHGSLPKAPFELSKGVFVLDTNQFIEQSLEDLKHPPARQDAGLHRLSLLKEIVEKNEAERKGR